MTAKLISIHNQKGGCGKSTLTALVANSLSQDCEMKVLVIDADLQYSLASSRETLKKNLGNEFTFSHDLIKATINTVVSIIKSNYKKYDVILIDMPGILTITPADEKEISTILYLCDIVVIPVKPSTFDIHSSLVHFKTVAGLKTKKTKQGGVLDVLCLINQKTNNKISSMMKTILNSNKVEYLNSELSFLDDYAEKSVSEKSILKSSNKNPRTRNEFLSFMEELEIKINE